LLLSNVLLNEQLASGRAIGAVWHKKLRERSGNFTKKSA
jgi:hypothetical protein